MQYLYTNSVLLGNGRILQVSEMFDQSIRIDGIQDRNGCIAGDSAGTLTRSILMSEEGAKATLALLQEWQDLKTGPA